MDSLSEDEISRREVFPMCFFLTVFLSEHLIHYGNNVPGRLILSSKVSDHLHVLNNIGPS